MEWKRLIVQRIHCFERKEIEDYGSTVIEQNFDHVDFVNYIWLCIYVYISVCVEKERERKGLVPGINK